MGTKQLRLKHYSYILLSVILAVFSVYKLVTTLNVVHAESTPVTITNPTANQTVVQGQQIVTGTGPALKKILIFDGDQKIGATTSLANGTWSLAWNNQLPGQHTLKAVVATGSIYKAVAKGANGIETTDANNGQVIQQYPAGLSRNTGVVYDPVVNKAYVVNDQNYSATISVYDVASQSITSTFPYTTQRKQTEGLTVRAYQFDQAHHRLFIADFENLYVVDTQSQSTLATIAYGPVGSGETVIRFDSDGQYAYLLNSGDQPSSDIVRINLQTKAIDNAWQQYLGADFPVYDVEPASNGDVYIISNNISSSRVYSETNHTLAALNVDGNICEAVLNKAFAMSNDYKTLYISCADSSNAKKIIAYSTETAEVVNTFNNNDGAEFLKTGYLTDDYLIVRYGLEGSDMQVINTMNNTESPTISGAGIEGDVKNVVNSGLENGTVINGGKAYFITQNTDNLLWHLYVVDLSTGQTIHQQSFDQITTGFPSVSGVVKRSGDNEQLLLSSFSNNKLYTLDAADGGIASLSNGIGNGVRELHAPGSDRIFTLNSSNVVTASSVSDPTTNTTVELPAGVINNSATLSEDGSHLYVLGVSATGETILSNHLYAIDTSTLAVEQIYNSLPILAGYSSIGPTMVVKNGNLYLASCSTLYKVNLANDTTASVSAGGCIFPDGSGESGLGTAMQNIAINNSGNTLALLTGFDTIKIFNTSNLQLSNTILSSSILSIPGLFGTVGFDSQDKLVVGLIQTLGTQTIYRFNANDGSLVGATNFSSGSTDASQSMCLTDTLKTNNTNYMYLHTWCQVVGNSPANDVTHREIFNLIDATNGKVIDSRSNVAPWISYGLYSSSFATDVDVGTATQTFNTVAHSISIISPAENESVTAGTHTITGSSKPNTTVTVKVDGIVVGTASSNNFGAWQLDHDFVSTGTHTVRAEQVDDDRAVLYVTNTSLAVFGDPSTNQNHDILEVDADSRATIDTITLPDGYFVGLQNQLSQDKSTLYTIGYKGDSTRLFKISTVTNTVVSSVELEGFVVNSKNVAAFAIDPNGYKIYMTTVLSGNGVDTVDVFTLHEYDVETGALLRSGTIPEEIAKPNLYSSVTFTNSGEQLLFGNNELSSIGKVDLTSFEISEVEAPPGYNIAGFTYDSVNDRLFTVLSQGIFNSDDNWTDNNVTIVATDGQTGSEQLSVTIPHVAAGLSPVYVSNDRKRIAIVVIAGATAEEAVPAVIVLNTQDGSHTLHTLSVTGTPSAYYSLGFGIAGNNDLSKVYLTHITVASSSNNIILGTEAVDLSTNPATVGEPLDAFSVGNNFSKTVTGSIVQDMHTINVTNSVTQPCVYNTQLLSTDPQCKPVTIVDDVCPYDVRLKVGDAGCKLIVTDACKDLPGIQTNTTQCPVASTTTEDTPPTPTQVAAGKVQLEKSEKTLTHRSLLQRFLNGAKKAVLKVPRQVVNSIPYVLFLIMLALAGYYLFQTQKQLRYEERLRALFKKQRVLAEEKSNFLELTSHYLRTPLTYIKAGSEMITKAQPNVTSSHELTESVSHLGLFIESLIEEASRSQESKLIGKDESIGSPWLKKSFLLPFVGFVTALALFYVSFSLIGGIHYSSAVYITQVIVGFMVVQILYGMYKNRQRVRVEEAYLEQTIAAEEKLDNARSKLMRDAGEQLQTRTAHLAGITENLSGVETSQKIITQGVERLQELSKAFALVSQLETAALSARVAPVSVKDFAVSVIRPFTDDIAAKNLRLESVGFDSNVMLTTNRPFAELTLKSLIENAIQASKEGSQLTIKCLHAEGRIAFQVIDHGEGIPKEKISQLFKPFVRVGPVTTFNREGVGLSLFIDRLVMHSLGGEVEIASRYKEGTVATLTFRQNQL